MSQHPQRLLVLSIILLAFGLRIAFVESRNATIDELSSLKWLAERSVFEIATQYHTNIHLLTTILARLIDYMGGHWLTFYRLPSLVFGVLTVPLTYQLGRRMVNGWAGLLAALLLAVAPMHVDFSIQMRGYTAATFWAAVMYLSLWRGLHGGGWRYWGVFAAAAGLAVYAHLFGALAVGASWLVVIGALIFRQQPRQRWQFPAVSLLLTVVLLLILYGPIFTRIVDTPQVESDWGTQVESLVVDGQLNGEAFEDYLKILRLYGPIGEPNSWFVMSFVLMAAVGLAAALTGLYPRRGPEREAGLYAAIWIMAPLAAAAFGMQFINGVYVFWRFFLFFQPLYLLLMANGMLACGYLAATWLKRPVVGKVATAGLLVMALGGAAWQLYHQASDDADNQWYRVARMIQTRGSTPFVVCEPYNQKMESQAAHKDECFRNLEFYFQPALGRQVSWLAAEIDQVATIPGASNRPFLEAQPGDVWIVLWQTEWPADDLNLGQTVEFAEGTYHFIGSTLLLQSPPQSPQLLALAKSIDLLLPWPTTPQDHFSYLLAQAQMKAVVGDTAAAQTAWQAARALSPEGVDAENQLRAVAELIGRPDLVSEE